MPSFRKEAKMHLSHLDAYFHAASHGDKEAFEELYQMFRKRALNYVLVALHEIQKYTGISKDFLDYIDSLFFKTINDYDLDRGTFSNYVDYVFKTRLIPKIQKMVVDNINRYVSLDESFDDNKAVELLADPDALPISKQIAKDNVQLRMSSNNKRISNTDRLRNKIMLYEYAGYSKVEICKELGITIGELRGHLSKLKEDDEMINFNLEMK